MKHLSKGIAPLGESFSTRMREGAIVEQTVVGMPEFVTLFLGKYLPIT
jgi:hypothetical protein